MKILKKIINYCIVIAIIFNISFGHEDINYVKKLAEQGDIDAQVFLGYIHMSNARANKEETIKLYKLSAKLGNAYAQFELASIYKKAKLDKEAFEWHMKAAKQGHALAQLEVANSYYFGVAVDKDRGKAVKWYRLSAEQGVALAALNIGLIYRSGQGDDMPSNDTEALRFMTIAANAGDPDAQSILASMYQSGTGIDVNIEEAVKWNKMAAEQGNTNAQINLGQMYELGQGVKQDDFWAFKWYFTANRSGFSDAQCYLANMYYEGRGTKQDYAKAIELYTRSALQDYSCPTMMNLVVMYQKGLGTKQDNEKAKEWMDLACYYAVPDACEHDKNN